MAGYLLVERLTQFKAKPTAVAIIRQLRRIRGAVQTVTFDNGFEFAEPSRRGRDVECRDLFL